MFGSDFVEGFTSSIGRMVGRNVLKWFWKILAFFGLNFVTYEGIVGPIETRLLEQMHSLPAQAVAWIGAFGIDIFLMLIVNAYLTRMLFAVGIEKKAA